MPNFAVDTERRAQILYAMEHLPPVTPLAEELKASIVDIPAAQRLEMYSFNGYGLEGLNGKGPPAFQLLLNKVEEGSLTPGSTLYVPSSGNTVVNIAYYRRAFGVKEVVGIVEPSTSIGKKTQFCLAGARVEYPRDGQTTIARAYELQQEFGGVVVDQYKEWGSVEGHRWTMDHIAREMKQKGKPVLFLCAGAGTCSTLVAADEYLRPHFPKLQIVGVACKSEKEKVPGCRTLESIERDITFPWRKAIAPYDLVFCDKYSAFSRSRDIIRTGKPAGPSCGLAVEGFLRRFRELYERGELEQFLNADGKYVVVFVFMDAFPAYGVDYLEVLGDKGL